jgi:hypothetical protein
LGGAGAALKKAFTTKIPKIPKITKNSGVRRNHPTYLFVVFVFFVVKAFSLCLDLHALSGRLTLFAEELLNELADARRDADP